MLKASEINYPIIFSFTDSRGSITFYSRDSKGIWSSGSESMFGVDTFVHRHNEFNKDNNPEFDYYYEMVESKTINDFLFGDDMKHLITGSSILTASLFATDYQICKIEEMPVGATLKGIQDCNGEWNEITFKPVRVEVHDDVITLLSGYAGWRPKGDKKYGAEINIKRGTNVKFS